MMGFIVMSPDGTVDIPFDIIIHTNMGCIFATCFKCQNKIAAIHANGKEETVTKTMSINLLHVQLGHCSEEMTCKAAVQLSTVLQKTPFKPCVACGMGKSKQKNVPKSHEEEAELAVSERLHVDISIIHKKEKDSDKEKSYVCPNWFMLVDAASGMKFSSFWMTKQEFIEPTCELLHRWLTHGVALKKIWCNHIAGQEQALGNCLLSLSTQWHACHSKNSKVEVGLLSLSIVVGVSWPLPILWLSFIK
jgi:hypothetical protein